MEQFWTIFWRLVGIILTGLASWLTVVITQWLNSKIKDKTLAKHATAVTNIIMGAVMAVTQTYVSTMKSNGKFTEEAHAIAMDKCMEIVKSQLSNELVQYISDNYGDVENYLKTRIEAMILELKK